MQPWARVPCGEYYEVDLRKKTRHVHIARSCDGFFNVRLDCTGYRENRQTDQLIDRVSFTVQRRSEIVHASRFMA